jgi:thiamine biosynthesis lipoprotein
MSVTVVAETAMDADALATAVFVMGVDDGMRLVEELPSVEALIITGDEDINKVIASSGLRGRFHASE